MNHPLWEHCEKHYKENSCQTGETPNGQASHLILCLNKAVADGMTEFVFVSQDTFIFRAPCFNSIQFQFNSF